MDLPPYVMHCTLTVGNSLALEQTAGDFLAKKYLTGDPVMNVC